LSPLAVCSTAAVCPKATRCPCAVSCDTERIGYRTSATWNSISTEFGNWSIHTVSITVPCVCSGCPLAVRSVSAFTSEPKSSSTSGSSTIAKTHGSAVNASTPGPSLALGGSEPAWLWDELWVGGVHSTAPVVSSQPKELTSLDLDLPRPLLDFPLPFGTFWSRNLQSRA